MIIYTVGDKQNGMGHVMRCLTLADELKRRRMDVSFITAGKTPGMYRILKSGYIVSELILTDAFWSYASDRVCLVDLKKGPTRALLEAMRPHFDLLIVVNGSGYMLHDRKAVYELSDFRVYQSLFVDDDPNSLSGVRHIIIDPRYADCRPDYSGPIVVSLGGSDPHGLTPLVIDALRHIKRDVIIVSGVAAGGLTVDMPHNMTLINAPASLTEVFDGASLYIGALGMSAYEAAAAGVPSLLTAWSVDHERTALALQEHDVCRSLGMWNALDVQCIRSEVGSLLDDEAAWRRMSQAGKTLVDGQGVKRVADALERMLNIVEVWQ